jgi:hypothetical protein
VSAVDPDVCCGCEPLHYCEPPIAATGDERWHCTICRCQWVPSTYPEAQNKFVTGETS